MKILVIGSGGREHALVWLLSKSAKVKKIYCAPGNGGMEQLATLGKVECVSIAATDISQLVEFSKKNQIHLTVVGPEAPLGAGIVDEFEKEGLAIFGPHKNAAIIEGSKWFAKEFCTRHSIPTASYLFFNNTREARAFLNKQIRYPLVIKADGLASGKGVIIAKDLEEASAAVDDMLVYEKFGEAGRKIIIEEFMEGEEATFMVVTDGETFLPFETAQDHKRLLDKDQGPNTGGMGAYSPAPLVTPAVYEKVISKIILPFIRGMKKEGRTYQGILYAGLMIHQGEPRLVEFNCRFGDPEAEAILFRIESDFLELIEATLHKKLTTYHMKFSPHPSVCVVMSSKGYPGPYESGKSISGLEDLKKSKDTFVFHAGTRLEHGKLLTAGGRVLVVTARAPTLTGAIQHVYKTVEKITWEGAFYRKDIGQKGVLL